MEEGGLDVKAWYMPVTREIAELQLRAKPYDSFLIRLSSDGSSFALSKSRIKTNGSIEINHLIIERNPNAKYFIRDSLLDFGTYPSVKELINQSPELKGFHPINVVDKPIGQSDKPHIWRRARSNSRGRRSDHLTLRKVFHPSSSSSSSSTGPLNEKTDRPVGRRRMTRLSFFHDDGEEVEGCHPHLFQLASFDSALFCTHCGGLIGRGGQGYKCTACVLMTVHEECFSSVKERNTCLRLQDPTHDDPHVSSEIADNSNDPPSMPELRSSLSRPVLKKEVSLRENLVVAGTLEITPSKNQILSKRGNLVLEKARGSVKRLAMEEALRGFTNDVSFWEQSLQSVDAARKELETRAEIARERAEDNRRKVREAISHIKDSMEATAIRLGSLEGFTFLSGSTENTENEQQQIAMEQGVLECADSLISSLLVPTQRKTGGSSPLDEMLHKDLNKRKEELTELETTVKEMEENAEGFASRVMELEKLVSPVQDGLNLSDHLLNSTKVVTGEETIQTMKSNATHLLHERLSWMESSCTTAVNTESAVAAAAAEPTRPASTTPATHKIHSSGLTNLSPYGKSLYSLDSTAEGTFDAAAKCISLDQIISTLTSSYVPSQFERSFFLTFPYFSSSLSQLAKLLFLRFCSTPEASRPPGGFYEKQDCIRKRVVKVLEYFVEGGRGHVLQIQVIPGEPEELELLSSLMKEIGLQNPHAAETAKRASTALMTLAARRRDGDPFRDEEEAAAFMRTLQREQQMQKKMEPPPNPIIPVMKEYSLLQLSPVEFARQITLYESQLFRLIRPVEFYKQGWTKKDKTLRSPHLMDMIKFSNKVSSWITTEIVKTDILSYRIEKVVRFAEIAQECLRLSNFNAVMEILAGLQASSVHRLKRTWKQVPKNLLLALDDMRNLMEQNFKKFRETISSAQPPVIPYIGVYLTDLTFLDETCSSVHQHGLVNFSKLSRIADAIGLIQQFQSTPGYNFQKVIPIQEKLTELDGIDSGKAFDLSLQIEPRDPS